MADERSRSPYNQKSPVLAGYDWASLVKKDGDELFDHTATRWRNWASRKACSA
jgi:hypothetical protein